MSWLWLLACADPAPGAKDSAADAGEAAELPPEMELGPVQDCPAPAEPAWVERGEEWGLLPSPDPGADHHHGGSLAVADLDQDGDLDMVVGWTQAPPLLYRREGELFAPESLPGPSGTFLLNLADMDGDGLLDLLAGGFKESPQVLLQGQGWAAMPLLDLPMQARRIRELSAGDLDGDGLPELYALTNAGAEEDIERTDMLLRNEGGALRWDPAAEVSVGRGFDALWTDADADGDSDIFVVNDDGQDYGEDRLLINQGGQLVAAEADCRCEIVHFGMGGDQWDLNQDGRPDWYLTGVGRNALLESQPDGTWADSILARRADPLQQPTHMGWGAIWLDLDNDGRRDLLVAQGDRWQDEDDEAYDIIYEAPINLLLGQADGSFAEAGPALGLAQEGSHRSAVAEDLNGDGLLDLVVTDVVDRPRLYLSEGCSAAGWLRVEAPPHTRLSWTIAGVEQVGWVSGESSYGAGHAPFLHIGLGEAEGLDWLVAELPDGRRLEGGPIEGRRRLLLR